MICGYYFEVIKWVDAYGVGSSWYEINDFSISNHYCFSVGWVVKENEESIVICPHISPENDEIESNRNGCGEMTIPKSAIVSRKKLKVSKK